MKFMIGNVEIEKRVLLAPMAGITNGAFFYIAKKYGAGLLSSEMISDKGLIHHNRNTLNLIKFDTKIRPFSVQLFGSKKEELALAASILYENTQPDIIDINMGCSVPKIFKSFSGVSLMANPEYVYEIVKAVKESVPCPITIKIRSGISHDKENFIEVAKQAERAGCSAIILHPRTKTEGFKGKANLDHIKVLKESVHIPVIGSGDIKTPMDAKRMLDYTLCDAVMVGRAALGNPFIFKQINDYLEEGKYEDISPKEKFDTMKEHFNYLVDLKGEKIAVLEMRSHASWYVKGMKDSTDFKKKLNSILTKESLLELIDEFQNKICEK